MNTKLTLSIIFLNWFFVITMNAQLNYQPDILGEDFLQSKIQFPDDYEGTVSTTLIKKPLKTGVNSKAVLYVHGFNDYFFQKEMAEKFIEKGYTFYAVDLRKYGRSYLPHQKFNNVRNLNEYFPDIDTCLKIIQSEGNKNIILMGHSTGGLITSLYANENRGKELFDVIVLNSPFFDMNLNPFVEKNIIPFLTKKGEKKPNKLISAGLTSGYGESLHFSYKGEWNYDLTLKPNVAPKVNYGWIRAIRQGQKKLQEGIQIGKPVLVMHSDKSVRSRKWNEKLQKADAVLDVNDIEKYAISLKYIDAEGVYIPTTILAIPDGMHDLILSAFKVRNSVYENLFIWLKQNRL